MYDGEGQPGRNDECWCGSGKKYKKCHWQTDERLQELYAKGYEVPTRDILKGPADIEAIKASAAINVGVLDMVAERIAPGVSTEEIDQWIYDYTIEHGGTPADLGYGGFPKSVCTSINDVICHGIPCKEDVLKEGDIVNIDCSTIWLKKPRRPWKRALPPLSPGGCWATWAPPYTNTPKRRAIRSCANTADTAVALNSTKTRS